jgi:GGDEF domain-containing protein
VKAGEHVLKVRASIGIAMSCSTAASDLDELSDQVALDRVDHLLRAADAAMYQAKSNPSGTRMHVSEHCQPQPALLAAETDVDRV